ncbi:hypothetical protein EHI8A_121240 [Entamoeba histolytica HM-1:IMSS-B]|uniref:5'-3' DNA helicase ZGRF1-like N-terminal domain-containing protein n=6 Tax=Entamoeba histolytica TaxID=5759 RepID=C4M5S4_ENTH1|nr:hypothetical protein EHI_070780 [Entamoeba histolytica HM-1:IMSS]EMD46886.1 Hypothetical protein EHI5A_155550 [Entamoeba histolytica KU27]EMH75093.1 hypothetical protein EHI8A_121240 [Entamoeba histolytica HM-1:IMSS-B]EMS13310.1 hypothetical protein KM1_192690 [Entamoeba histolytica HM-3:IMSS]ENY59955.1 hypothetical protein EHI7A_110880 [Entamoeba histolytica HM-1:IMSS-A]GAT96798.1 hypothetical protein CL6EHI_070780 [Entamoeba histolytica]|eukprot:XP_654413.1 hypothetical protein EHI_070780 [Entamoeba histolytica HM-1:IMSS]
MSEEEGELFKVLYSKDITQRIKKKYDGYAIFRSKYRRFELYEDDDGKPGKQIDCETINETEVKNDMIINLPTFIVEVFESINTTEPNNQKEETKPKKILKRKKTIPKPLHKTNSINTSTSLINSQQIIIKSKSFSLKKKRSVEDILKIFENN